MENYEEKYKQALETARKINSGEGVAGPKDWSILEVIFPELKKSKDELIREEILNCFVEMKKQGCFPSKHKEQYDSWITWLEKQGEQKPTDKFKPKFKVGDWIISNDDSRLLRRIVTVDKIGYTTDCGYSSHYENYFHLWTIRDAKDSDILANKDGCIFIYNSNISNYLTLRSYCYLSIQGKFLLEDYNTGSWLYADEVTPATKEQRDLLFQKMREAGYEWNSNKKELIKQ